MIIDEFLNCSFLLHCIMYVVLYEIAFTLFLSFLLNIFILADLYFRAYISMSALVYFLKLCSDIYGRGFESLMSPPALACFEESSMYLAMRHMYFLLQIQGKFSKIIVFG